MKTIKLTISIAIIIVMGALGIVACGEETVGTYKFSSLSVGDNTYKVGDVYEEAGTEPLTKDFYTLELKSDGTATLSSPQGEPITGKWTASEDDENQITLTSGETTVTLTKSGNTLTFSQNGVTVLLSK